MDFETGKPPNLIGPIMKSTVNKVIKKPTTNSTISDQITTYVSDFYNNYIVDNKFLILIVIIIIVFLIYRYYNTKNKKQQEPFTKEENNLIKQIQKYQTKNLEYSEGPPHMNPIISVEDQPKDQINYPPDPLPINLPDKGIVYTRNIYENPPDYPALNHVNYDYNNVYQYPSRSYYSGANNTYKNAQDTTIINPYDWSNKFNTNTGNFVTGMTNTNRQVLIDYQTSIDNEKAGMINGANDGYIPPYNIEPPYSQ
jgi:hypothetical protein